MNEHSYVDAIHRQMKKLNQGSVRDTYAWKVFDPYQGGKADARYEFPQFDLRNGSHCNRTVTWVEYKFLTLPKRDSTPIHLCSRKDGLSALQQSWLRDRYLNNISIAVIVGSSAGSLILTDLSWESPVYRMDFVGGLTVRQVAEWLWKQSRFVTQEGIHGTQHRTQYGRL